MKNNFKNIFKKILICIIVFLSCIPSQTVDAWWWESERTMWITLYDEENFEISYMFFDDSSEDLKNITKKFCTYKNGNESNGGGVCNFSSGDASLSEDNFNVSGQSGSDKGIDALVFPRVAITNNDVPLTAKDYKQGEKVIGTLTNSLNSAIAFIKSSDSGNTDSLENLSQQLATAAHNGGGSVGGISVSTYSNASQKSKDSIDKSVAQLNASWGKNVISSDYIVLKNNETGEELPVMWRCPTGYGSGQIYSTDEAIGIDDEKISWVLIVTVATTAKAGGYTADGKGFEVLQTKDSLEKSLSEFADSITKKLSIELLGFYSLESMILNRGTRGSSYYLGMMPYNWFRQSNNIFWIAEIIAVFILIASVLYSVFKENWSIVSPKERINLQDRIQNLLISILLLLMYVPLFYLMGKFNQSIIEMLDSLVVGQEFSVSPNLNWILSLVVAIANLIILIKINVDYLVRALTITVLHAIAPVMIASVSISNNGTKGLFNTWLREMIGAIFLQTFDAVILVLYMMIIKTDGASRWWEIALMTFMFIPINKWFREKFTGASSIGQVSGATQQSAGAAVNKAWGAATGAVKGTVELGAGIAANAQTLSAAKTQAERQVASTGKNNGAAQSINIQGKGRIVPLAGGEKAQEDSFSSSDNPNNEEPNNSSEKAEQQFEFSMSGSTESSKGTGDAIQRDGRPKKAKLSGKEKAAAVGAAIASQANFRNVSSAIMKGQENKFSSSTSGTISNEFSTGGGDTFDSKGDLKRVGTNLDARKYHNTETEEKYNEELSKNYTETMNRFNNLSEEELDELWDEEYSQEISDNMNISKDELTNTLENDSYRLKNVNKEAVKNEGDPKKKQQMLDQRKQKMAQIYATSKTNANFDNKNPEKFINVEKEFQEKKSS